MATQITLPMLGNSMEEGTIVQWLKAEGETVQQGEALYEVMTDKVNQEVDAPSDGILLKILAPVDTIVPVHAPVALLGVLGETLETSPQEPELEKSPISFLSPRARRTADELGVDISAFARSGSGPEGRVLEADVLAFYEASQGQKPRASRLAQRVADVHGVALTGLAGTGTGGKVTHDDVRRLVDSSLTAANDQIVPLRGMRKLVADAVSRSASTAPHVTLTMPVDMAEANRFRRQVLPAIEKTHGVRVSLTDLIAKATARVLQDHPHLNSTLSDDQITLHSAVHMGIAISLGTEGLIVPVVRDAHQKTLGQFSTELKQLVKRAKEGILTSEEVTGGTFSLTNLGTFGVTHFNPIINPPQAAILGICATVETVIPVDGQPQIRPMMNLCLSFDHRVVDGAPAAAFLQQLRATLEQPYLIFV